MEIDRDSIEMTKSREIYFDHKIRILFPCIIVFNDLDYVLLTADTTDANKSFSFAPYPNLQFRSKS